MWLVIGTLTAEMRHSVLNSGPCVTAISKQGFLHCAVYNFILSKPKQIKCLVRWRLDSTASWHSVESPSMVDPQWNIWYWGSKWNLHTVSWSMVCCEWGTTTVYFGITYVCFIPSRLPVFAVEPQYLLQYFLFLSKVPFELHIQIFKKCHVGLKYEWGL